MSLSRAVRIWQINCKVFLVSSWSYTTIKLSVDAAAARTSTVLGIGEGDR